MKKNRLFITVVIIVSLFTTIIYMASTPSQYSQINKRSKEITNERKLEINKQLEENSTWMENEIKSTKLKTKYLLEN